MMRSTLIPAAFVFASIGFASASTYNVKLLEPTKVHGTDLKAGEYKLDIDNGKAVFRHGKQSAEAPVKIANADRKFKDTKFIYDNGSLREIDLGGSNMRVMLED